MIQYNKMSKGKHQVVVVNLLYHYALFFFSQKHKKVFGGGGAIFTENFDELNYFDAAKWSDSSGVRVRLKCD